MRDSGQWYVSYTIKSDDGARRYARKTQTFKTEELAKLFAREIIANGLRPTAGTINPYSPKTIISATGIATWLETPMQLSGSNPAAKSSRSQERSS
jgi:Arm DNA-binding domain